ncbi:hypothetical protein [Nonomuraea sp. NPDC005650]|uniref:hypothetical protein n=1 Tax=Nonomuraea sp. NPDC005650 TaxID=3157045 RepID=UPI0033AE454E
MSVGSGTNQEMLLDRDRQNRAAAMTKKGNGLVQPPQEVLTTRARPWRKDRARARGGVGAQEVACAGRHLSHRRPRVQEPVQQAWRR